MSSVKTTYGYYQNLADGTYLPSVKSGYGITYNIPFLDTEQTAHFPYNRVWDYYEEGTSTPIKWFDYSTNANELATKSNFAYSSDFWDKHYTLFHGFTDITEDELESLKSSFNADVSWLWGSLDDGGAFMFKNTRNYPVTDPLELQYRFFICWGEFEREPENPDYSHGKYFYYATQMDGGNRRWLEQTYNVGFYLNADDDAKENNVVMSVYYCTNAENNRVFCGNCSGSSSVFMEQPEVATALTEWDTNIAPEIFVSTPARAWYFEGGSTNSASDVYGFDFDNTIWISGNPFSDDDFGSEPSGTGGNTTGGGYGSPSQDTGDVDGESADDLNLLTAINSGLCTLYNPTASELTAFAEFLYTGITDSIETQLKKLVTNPLDYVLFVALAKFSPTISGRQEISFAGVGSGVSSAKISNQFIEVDCGTISYNEQFKSFLDYAPNSSVKLYLPFCSTVDLSVDDIMGSAINVNYLIDMLSGCCIARVKITRQVRSSAPYDSRVNDVLYEFQGNVYLTVPISATDWRGAYQSLVSLAGGVIGGISSGGVGGALAIASSVASSVTSQKVSVGRSGQAGSSYGYMNNKKPYLILERPIQSVPTGWGSFEGYMSNVRQKVGKLKGYTEIDAGTLWADGFDGITSDEMDMLKQITSSGFYL